MRFLDKVTKDIEKMTLSSQGQVKCVSGWKWRRVCTKARCTSSSPLAGFSFGVSFLGWGAGLGLQGTEAAYTGHICPTGLIYPSGGQTTDDDTRYGAGVWGDMGMGTGVMKGQWGSLSGKEGRRISERGLGIGEQDWVPIDTPWDSRQRAARRDIAIDCRLAWDT